MLTDYNLSAVIMPTVLVSSYIGAMLNLLLPTIIVVIFATLTLLLLTIQSIMKARYLYIKESEKKKILAE